MSHLPDTGLNTLVFDGAFRDVGEGVFSAPGGDVSESSPEFRVVFEKVTNFLEFLLVEGFGSVG